MSKKHRITPELKVDILKRIKEEGIPVAQASQEHGVRVSTIYRWLTKGASGNPTWSEFSKVQKQNRELLELVGEMTLRLSNAQKKIS